jgi:ribosome biogenesis GTPase
LLGRVDKGIAGRFTVRARDGGEVFDCAAKGKLKIDGDIYVGDIVEFDARQRIVIRVLKRKNFLTRPYVANVDFAVIVLSPVPEPDFCLADKILIDAVMANIEPVICVNKCDIDGDGEGLRRRVAQNYGDVARIIYTSAITGDISQFLNVAKDKTVCLAGQSAVGKTSILNALLDGRAGKVGDISHKSQRGKHTTRHSEIFAVGGGLVVDTSGFSELNIPQIEPSKLKDYYADFTEYAEVCKYRGCIHVSESRDECAVKRAAEDGELCAERYSRYVELYKQSEQAWKKRYN